MRKGTGPESTNWPKQPDFAGTTSIFFGTKQGVISTGLLASTVYTGRTGQYNTESTPLLLRQLQHATPSLKMNRYRN